MYQNCGDTGGKSGPEMEKPVQAQEVPCRKNRTVSQRRDVDRNQVGKLMSRLSRKAAIVYMIPVP